MRKLLVVRNDKLGDLILILPALKLIKSSCSNIQIDCLVDKKYSEISSITKYIDNTIYDDTNLVEVINIMKVGWNICLMVKIRVSTIDVIVDL